MHSNKKDQDLKVGNLLTLEGGVAYNVPKIGGAFGIGYYLQNKLSDDSGADVPVSALRALNLYGQNRLFGIGPDVTMAVFQKRRHDWPGERPLSLGIGGEELVPGQHVPGGVHHRQTEGQLTSSCVTSADVRPDIGWRHGAVVLVGILSSRWTLPPSACATKSSSSRAAIG